LVEAARESTYRCAAEMEAGMASCIGNNGDRWEIYSASDGWRWRRTARNGDIVGASTQAYSNKSDCIDNARRNGMDCDPT
jgi:uncharacterized protein YegP (UPF0339 family)